MQNLKVTPISYQEAARLVITYHYLHRKPPISFAYGLVGGDGSILGCITLGTPASRHMLIGACKTSPENVIELNRLWCHDSLPKNTESWFISRVLAALPPKIVLSYADTSKGHLGYVYRAANFYYAGWTDMNRKTPRFDYVVPGKHSRDAFRTGFTHRVRRKPKIKYWTVTGNRRERKHLESICLWPKFDWKTMPPPIEHKQADFQQRGA